MNTTDARRRLSRVRSHLVSTHYTSSSTTTTTTTTNDNADADADAKSQQLSTRSTSSTTTTKSNEDISKSDLKLRGWGYNDTKFFLNDDDMVELSGDRYPQAFPPNVRRVFPRLKEFMEDRLHMNVEETSFMHDKLPDVDPPVQRPDFVAALTAAVASAAAARARATATASTSSPLEMYDDHRCRLRHALGCTMEEVWMMRYADRVARAPDLVIYPRSHEEVELIVQLAVVHDVVIIPYGGGTTVSGSIECPKDEKRCIVSLDMSRMNKIKLVDRENMLACIEAGTIGTEIERKLDALGLIMGHEPDSYEHSTMGGWIATVSCCCLLFVVAVFLLLLSFQCTYCEIKVTLSLIPILLSFVSLFLIFFLCLFLFFFHRTLPE